MATVPRLRWCYLLPLHESVPPQSTDLTLNSQQLLLTLTTFTARLACGGVICLLMPLPLPHSHTAVPQTVGHQVLDAPLVASPFTPHCTALCSLLLPLSSDHHKTGPARPPAGTGTGTLKHPSLNHNLPPSVSPVPS
ncbi:hypothetical protein E2C01_003484 [Portunus trituberculatus]|uniref:Uncharacterized protein n=1 Tax=Portunus trituberculatus TaxID=210409 RepID=A0A5B7CMX6_PORTR|nr:hypothetical protein [Portunus trituberculatus]